MNKGRPQSLPTCEHGNRTQNCVKCRERDKGIREIVSPLATEFWAELPKRNANLEHMLYRAYRMGMQERVMDLSFQQLLDESAPFTQEMVHYLKERISGAEVDLDKPLTPDDE